MTLKPTRVIRIFYSYAHEDKPLRDELETHLSPLKREGKITEWHDREILPGKEWAHEIDKHLQTADIILLLISPNFLESEYCYSIEMKQALGRHENGEASVIPILLRPADWENAPFSKLQVLPANHRPVVKWTGRSGRDEAFVSIVKGIRTVISELTKKQLLGKDTPYDKSTYEDIYPSDLNHELTRLRIRANLSQNQLSNLVGVSNITVRNWEASTSRPNAKVLRKLIEVYLRKGTFTKQNELEEAKGLWEKAGLREVFDEVWFRAIIPNQQKLTINHDEKQGQKKYSRGMTLLEAAENAGLEHIENRDNFQYVLPPEQFYEMAKCEIVITGVSAYRTFDQDIDLLHKMLKVGKRLRLLLLNPDSPDVEELSRREKLDIRASIETVINIIKLEELDQHPSFEIRFMQKLPPFTAVMIDGDVNPRGKVPQDADAQIRVQPATIYGVQHKGVILQFKKRREKPEGAFDYFAGDVREQWRGGVKLQEVLEYLNQQH
jgi:transcriptional regulator with XRE-family HTH domain